MNIAKFLKASVLKIVISTGLRPATLSKKRLWQRCFPVNFAKFLRASFFYHITLLVAASIMIEKTDVFREDDQKRIQNPVKPLRWNVFQK